MKCHAAKLQLVPSRLSQSLEIAKNCMPGEVSRMDNLGWVRWQVPRLQSQLESKDSLYRILYAVILLLSYKWIKEIYMPGAGDSQRSAKLMSPDSNQSVLTHSTSIILSS